MERCRLSGRWSAGNPAGGKPTTEYRAGIMELTGTVVKMPFAPASKSAHEAVFLQTEQGDYKLEREEGNPFKDPELEKLIGRRISCEGRFVGYVFRITDWKMTNDE